MLFRTAASTVAKGSAVPSKKAPTVPLPIVTTPKEGAADSKRKAPTILEATDARATPQNPNGSKKARTMHQSVMKIYRDNVKGWEDWTLRHKVNDHKDFYARSTHDKENMTRTGKYYFSEIRSFEKPAQANMRLTATNEQAQIDGRLEKALIAHLTGFCVPPGACFEDIRQPNQLNFIAILRFLLDVLATEGWKQIHMVIKACRWVLAVRGHDICQVDFFDVHAQIDKLLFQTWQLKKAAGTATKDWWVIVCHWAQLILTPMPFQKLALVSSEQHKDWTALVPELQIVCKESLTGSMIFENAFKDVQRSFMSQLLETLSKFKKAKVWDNAALMKCKDEFAHDALTKYNADIHEIWPRARCHKIDSSGIKYVVV